jgi:hypothetical protein
MIDASRGALMSEAKLNQGSPNNFLGRLIESVPAQYRQEVTRVANRIRDRLPPIRIEHRIDALERHVDERMAQLEAKVDEILRRLEKR